MFIPEWIVLLLVAAVMLAAAEAGFRAGRRHADAVNGSWKDQLGAVQGAILGLLALLLGFTFSMALGRYDARRLLVVGEANAIGTTYLRASLLPAAHREPVKQALRNFVQARIEARSRAMHSEELAAALQATSEIERTLWRHAEAAAEEAPTQITATFVETLNNMIDTDAMRVAAARAQIPTAVWVMLLVVAATGCLMTGYRGGADNQRTPFATWLLPMLITFVIILIFDLSNPLQGFIGISQQPLLDLQQFMGT